MRRSPPRCWRSARISTWTRHGSTPMAGPSRSAIPSVPAVPGSPVRRPLCWPATAAPWRWPPCASAAARASRPCWKRSDPMTEGQSEAPPTTGDDIKTVAVFGAGVMGAAIAAHMANAGLTVLLYDLATDGPDPAATARKAIARMAKESPGPFMRADFARRVTPLALDREGDLAALAAVDWAVEAVVEKAAIKQALY